MSLCVFTNFYVYDIIILWLLYHIYVYFIMT